MIEKWNNVVVTNFVFGSYLRANSDKKTKQERPHHTFLLSDPEGLKRYWFSDGTFLESGACDFRYLPQGSRYRIERVLPGGCWAIQFSAAEPISCGPFNMHIRNYDALKALFQEALAANSLEPALRWLTARKCVYAILEQLYLEEWQSTALPHKLQLLRPALERIEKALEQNEAVHIAELSKLCGLSDAYLRKLFVEQLGMSPKEYLTQKRMERAMELLGNGYTVAQTAIACGYTEACHFSREFSRRTGISPKQYQLSQRAE